MKLVIIQDPGPAAWRAWKGKVVMTRQGQQQRTPETVQELNLHWALDNVAEALRGLRYGAVTLIIQDGVVVQVERMDRRRYQRSSEHVPSRD